MKRLSIPMPVDVDLSRMEWIAVEPEPELSPVVSAFRTAATAPLAERLDGTLSTEGGQR